MVAALVLCPTRHSSPCTRRAPYRGFSPASRMINQVAQLVGYRQAAGEGGWVHRCWFTRWCQASKVRGVTIRCPWSSRGSSSRASPASGARPSPDQADCEDPSSADLVQAITDSLEKHAWMVSAKDRFV